MYCDVEDVKARAGRLRDAWDDTTQPSDGDIERFIRDAGSAVEMGLVAFGFTAPATDPYVLASLTPVVADIALLMTLAATWPGESGGNNVTALKDEVGGRVYGPKGAGGYIAALRDGTLPAFQYLRDQNQSVAGAADFWTNEAGYSAWLDDWQSGAFILDPSLGGYRLRSPVGPGIHRDTKF